MSIIDGAPARPCARSRFKAPSSPPPQALSPLAQSLKKAGGAKESRATRDLLSQSLGMRTLVASLWTYDPDWSESKFPVFALARDEQSRFDQTKQGLEKMNFPMTPTQVPNRQPEIDKACQLRYREIFIHSKLMVIDDSMFTLGSANLNVRSFAVDSEINIASDDAPKAKDLRQRVWKQHTTGHTKERTGFDGGGDATDQEVMLNTFSRWEKEAAANSDSKEKGKSLSSFLVKFLDERTSMLRAG